MTLNDANPIPEKLKVNLRKIHCTCAVCGEHFNSAKVFDLHRVGTFMPMARRCLSPAQMRAIDWSRTPEGFWVNEKRARDQAPGMPIRHCARDIGAEISLDPLPTQALAA